MNREILGQPFGPEQIKQREGSFGKTLEYVEGHTVIQRLNDAFDGEWCFTIIRHEILKETDEVLVLGELKAGGIVKSQFGSSRITRARETGDIISMADDLKAAATDALKKAATLLGVGLHLYRNDRPQGAYRRLSQNRNAGHGNNGGNNTNSGNENGRSYQSHDNSGNGSNGYRGNGGNNNGGHHRPNGNGGYGGNGNNSNGRLTSNQYKYILKLGEERGRNLDELDRYCLESFGSVVQYLSKNDASNLIQQMLVS